MLADLSNHCVIQNNIKNFHKHLKPTIDAHENDIFVYRRVRSSSFLQNWYVQQSLNHSHARNAFQTGLPWLRAGPETFIDNYFFQWLASSDHFTFLYMLSFLITLVFRRADFFWFLLNIFSAPFLWSASLYLLSHALTTSIQTEKLIC